MTSINNLSFDSLIGQKVGTVTLLKELARGGMAVIFVAYQQSLKRQIAVKILPRSILTPMGAELFQQEAESAAILSHPNIVPIYEIGDTDDFLFFTMQLVNGKSLSETLQMARKHLLPSKRILPVKDTIKIITSVLGALDYAHNQEIVHRDIKPANILIESPSNRPMITDFGIAKLSRGANEKTELIVGTPLYMAPEQILGEAVDGRADIYSAGTILFEMLVSNLPLPKVSTPKELLGMKLSLKDRLFQKKPTEINPNIDKELEEIVLKAIAFYPEKRYGTSRAFMQALEQYFDSRIRNQS